MLSPASPLSSSLRNISTPVTTVFVVGRRPDDLHLLADLDHPALDPTRHHRAAPRDREHVLDRHQERPVLRRAPAAGCSSSTASISSRIDSLPTASARDPPAPHSALPLMIGILSPGKLVLRQQLAHLQLHQVQQLRVVHHVDLVHVDHQRRHPHLARQQDMLPRLRHRAVRRAHHQDRTVHLRRPRDHVLHVVRVPRAIHMRVVPVLRLVLHMRRR